MNEAAFKERIRELNEMATRSPLVRSEHTNGSQGIYQSQPPSSTPSTDDCLDLLRLQMKYLLFDLEATRRENHYLRKMLESRPRRGSEEGDANDPGWQTPPG